MPRFPFLAAILVTQVLSHSAYAFEMGQCGAILRNVITNLGLRQKTEKEKVRDRLAMVEPMLTTQASQVDLDWKGIEKQVRIRSRNLREPKSRLEDLTISIWVNGVEFVNGLPWGTTSFRFFNRPHGQVDYYVAYLRGKKIVHRSSFGLLESKDGQQLSTGSFDRRYAGELLGVTYGDELGQRLPSPALTEAAVQLSYNKIVWVVRPSASEATRKFVESAEQGVNVRAQFGPDGAPASVEIEDRATGIKTTASPDDFFFKVDAAFNGNSFFWDDMIVAVSTVAHHPWLVQSTLEFWLTVQELNAGVIPREVRKSNLKSLFFAEKILYGEEPQPNLVYTNPYLMNWVMDELYRYNPSAQNLALLKRVAKSVEDYAQWMEIHRAVIDPKGEIIGFNGSALGTGADNSRGRIGNRNEADAYKSGLVDFLAQQIKMYKDLARWSRMLAGQESNPTERSKFESRATVAAAKAGKYTDIMNLWYWNPEHCFYFDLIPDGANGWKQNLEYRVVGGFWPLWAGVPNQSQLQCLVAKQMSVDAFGGDFPFPANARDTINQHRDDLYVPRPGAEEDGYWDKWAHWPPMVMMAIEGFRRMGRMDLAYEYAVNFLIKIGKWSTTTVEESYGEFIPRLRDGSTVHRADGSISFDARAIQHSDHAHRENFAGWGKGPPVYMLLTHVIGLRPDYQGKLQWNLMVPMDVGQWLEIENLQYMNHTIRSLKIQRVDTDTYELTVDSDGSFEMELNFMRDPTGRLLNRPVANSGILAIPAGRHKSFVQSRQREHATNVN